MKQFLKEVKAEFKKINWTSGKRLFGLFKTTFLATIIITLVIFLVDNGFSQLVNTVISLF